MLAIPEMCPFTGNIVDEDEEDVEEVDEDVEIVFCCEG